MTLKTKLLKQLRDEISKKAAGGVAYNSYIDLREQYKELKEVDLAVFEEQVAEIKKRNPKAEPILSTLMLKEDNMLFILTVLDGDGGKHALYNSIVMVNT